MMFKSPILRISLTPLVGRALLLFKNTNVAMAIAVAELTYKTGEFENLTFKTFTLFGIATIFSNLLGPC